MSGLADDIAVARDALVRGQAALMPTDTVYGLTALLDDPAAVALLYAIKHRPRSQPCQVLVYGAEALEQMLRPVDTDLADIVRALLPGTTTCIVPDPAGRAAEASGDAVGSIGIRAPRMDPAFASIDVPLVATSANDPGGPDPKTIADVPQAVRDAVAARVDVGALPGTASAVVDLRERGRARILRAGPDPIGLTASLRALGVDVPDPSPPDPVRDRT